MSFLRGSTNYVWCTTSVLGKGATGAVFQGVNKNNGEPVAVKTFNQLSHMRPHEVQMREFEVLKKVKHENIVKLLAIEEEQESRGKVIVMELCTGGSLFNILDDPENTYGVQEEEFLLVLEHLTAGMKHLRDHNLVHRDLKPGNIMKFVCDDGRHVYKLTDFGAARELEEDQQFVSLYGTEEYLHPDMYERAVLRKPVGKTFGATVDLWSIGVTLYHVATGSLPFRPYGGRKNKETMYYITTKKASGVISGSQSAENGPIDWFRELPRSCQLSAGLKKMVTPILAGLLEVDPQHIWSFDRFFAEVISALARKPIHVFNVNRVEFIVVYLHAEDHRRSLLEGVREQTVVPEESQLLLFGSSHLADELGGSGGDFIPRTTLTTKESPLFLFSRENNNVTLTTDGSNEAPAKFPNFPNLVSVETDASLAKNACSVGHTCKRRVERLSACSRMMHEGVGALTLIIAKELQALMRKFECAAEAAKLVGICAEAATRGQKSAHLLAGFKNVPFNDWKEEADMVSRDLHSNLSVAVHHLYQRCVAEKSLLKEWQMATRSISCPAQGRATEKVKTLVDRLRESWQHLLRDRATTSLTYNDQQFHVLERIKIKETGIRVKTLLEVEVQPAVCQLAECMADWYKMAQTAFLQTRILDKDLDAFTIRCKEFALRLQEGDARFHEGLANMPKLKYGANGKHGRVRGQDLRSYRASLKDIQMAQEEIGAILKENSELVNQIQSIAHCSEINEENNS